MMSAGNNIANRLQPKMMSFDVFGTLISVRDSSYGAFSAFSTRLARVISMSGRSGNIGSIETSGTIGSRTGRIGKFANFRLLNRFAHFGIAGEFSLINHYFDAFAKYLARMTTSFRPWTDCRADTNWR